MAAHDGDLQNTIFIVDDNPANTKMLRQVIEDQGFGAILVFNDPEEALREFHRLKPNLVLLDLLMPKLSGIDFLKQIENEVQSADVAVIILTASQDEASKMNALSMGAQDYIAKPFNVNETLQRIHNVFNLQQTKASYQHLSKDLAGKLQQTRSDLSDVILTLNALFKNSSEYVFITDTVGNVIDFNRAAQECFHVAERCLEERNLFDLFAIEELSVLAEQSELSLTNALGKHIIVEVSHSEVVVNNNIHNICIFKDITIRKEDEINLRFLSETHYITHLPNRNQLHRMVKAKCNALPPDVRLSFMFVSFVDNNREVELFGHDRLECLLLNIALMLVEFAAIDDSVLIHWGDNDFLLVEDAQQSSHLMDRIQHSFNEPIKISDSSDVSIYSKPVFGVCYSDKVAELDANEFDDLVHNALLATYEGVRLKRHVMLYDKQLHQKISYQAMIEKELLKAIEGNVFKVAYQPKVDLKTGEVVGAEALVRWYHQTQGMIGPDVFIPIAENAGLINEIGSMVLTHVCRDVAQLKHMYPYIKHVAINVAAPQLDHNFVDLLINACNHCRNETHDFRNDFIELEITETSFLDDFDRVNPILKEIKALGFRLAIDDFGTGYSSLSYLHELPVDTLKIDRSFVIPILTSKRSLLMVKSIISMSLALGLEIVAEGIEDAQTGEMLCQLGVQQGQGYYYYKPAFLSS